MGREGGMMFESIVVEVMGKCAAYCGKLEFMNMEMRCLFSKRNQLCLKRIQGFCKILTLNMTDVLAVYVYFAFLNLKAKINIYILKIEY